MLTFVFVENVLFGLQTKLDSFLEKDHYKALVLMRQLNYTGRSFLQSYTKDEEVKWTYLSKDLAQDIENVLLDMM